MSQLEKYRSSNNLVNDTIKQISQSKQVGELNNIKLDPNTSGKLLIKLNPPFTRKPLINVTVSVESGSELEVSHSVAKLTNESFELHLLNSDMTNQVQLSIIWSALPSN
jgi:hypothetical protein